MTRDRTPGRRSGDRDAPSVREGRWWVKLVSREPNSSSRGFCLFLDGLQLGSLGHKPFFFFRQEEIKERVKVRSYYGI